jgi:selenocysteine-specific elongation factor
VNLAGVDVAHLERGMVLAEPRTLRTTQIIDARIDVLPNASRGVRSRSRVRLHVNAAEVLARVRVLDHPSEIASGKSGLAQLRVESPISTVHGDRFILRSYSPAETIAGGVVLDPFAVKHRGKDMGQARARINRLSDANRVDKLAAFVEMSELGGRTVEDLVATTGLKREVINDLTSQAKQQGGIVEAGGLLLSPFSLARLSEGVLSELENYHKREPLARGMLRETLREKVFTHSPPELFAAVIQKLEASGRLVAERLAPARET